MGKKAGNNDKVNEFIEQEHEEYVKKLYRTFPAARIAGILDITVKEVEAIAARLGLKKGKHAV
jgi:hypothetical protein